MLSENKINIFKHIMKIFPFSGNMIKFDAQ